MKSRGPARTTRTVQPSQVEQQEDESHLQIERYEQERARCIAWQAMTMAACRSALATGPEIEPHATKLATAEIRLLANQLAIFPTEIQHRDRLLQLAVGVKGSSQLNPMDLSSSSKQQREADLLAHPAAAELLALFVESLVRLADAMEGRPSRSKQHPDGVKTGDFRSLLASAFRAQGEHSGRSISASRKEELNAVFRRSFLGADPAFKGRRAAREFEVQRRKALDEVYRCHRAVKAPAGTDHHAEVIKLLGSAYHVFLEDFRPSS